MAKQKQTPKKTAPQVSTQRVNMSVRSRFNPIRNLTPEIMARQLESFNSGYISGAALSWQKIEDRDDILTSVVPKRKKAVSQHGYEIITLDDSPEAQRHKDVLENFYNNLTATDATDLNYRGGVSLLIRQMMDAVGKKYAVHEIVWEPSADGLTATFYFVPLWFFEHTTSRLRYLEHDGAREGVEMPDGEWLVTAGDGLMTATCVAYIFKHIPLKDWLIYCERHGMPGLQGKTDAKEGSTEWNVLVSALENFGIDWSMVTNRGVDIEKLDMSSNGELPFPTLVERMDRAMASIWRGADLSTMSSGSGEGTGASLQGDEAEILEVDDAMLISEALNEQVDRWVIRYALGAPRALAYIKINTGTKQATEQDIKIDQFFVDNKIPTSRSALYHRYGRPEPEDEEDTLAAGAAGPPPAAPQAGLANSLRLANAKTLVEHAKAQKVRELLIENSVDLLAQAQAKDLQPVSERIAVIMQIEDEELRDAALQKLKDDLPKILIAMNDSPESATVLEEAMAAGVINGFAEAATTHEEAVA